MSGWGSIYNNTTSAIGRQSQILADLQEQASSGNRVIRTSDDPGAANRILQLRSQSRSLDTYVKNIQSVTLSLGEIDMVLAGDQSVSSALIEASSVLTQAGGTLSQQQISSMSGAIDGLLEQIVSLANHKSVGRYIFSGANASTPPYAIERDANGKITSVTYQGAQADLPVPVAPGVSYSGLMVGDDVFRSNSRGDPVFLGATGATAGAGTSNVTGDVYLTVSRDQTAYPASTLARGDDCDAGDTIIGEHTLTLNSTDMTLQLDGGPAASFQLGDTSVAVTSADGSVAYVDVSGWAPPDGDVEITIVGRVKLSIDGGETETVVSDFSVDSTVADADGKVLYVDPSGITATGTEAVRIPGTYNVFDMLINVRDLMTNEAHFDRDVQKHLLVKASASLEEIHAKVLHNAAIAGARSQAMANLEASLDNVKFATEQEADSKQQADFVQVTLDLARTQSLYELTLRTAGKMLSLSLLDFI
ncbi:MAG: hypothetical protein J7M14_03650 [Planctomycetes bacterium]|nr:hypothetical protein [Planctomycetota bacterium]